MLIQEFYTNIDGLDSSIPLFHTHVRGTRIVVTLQLVTAVLHVPRVEHPNYLGCKSLRTVSKDEMISAYLRTVSKDEMISALCKHPSNWGDR